MSEPTSRQLTLWVSTEPVRHEEGYFVELWQAEPYLDDDGFCWADGESWMGLGWYTEPESVGFPPPGQRRACTIVQADRTAELEAEVALTYQALELAAADNNMPIKDYMQQAREERTDEAD